MPIENTEAQAKPTEEETEPIKEKIVVKTVDPSPSQVSMRQDVSVASAAMHKTMDSMTKQWGSVKDVSETVTTNFERVAKHLQELNDSYHHSMKDLIKHQAQQHTRRPSTITKVAVGFSGIALILSLISLAFSQSVRQSVFNTGVALPSQAVSKRSARPKAKKRILPPCCRRSQERKKFWRWANQNHLQTPRGPDQT